MTTIEKSTQFKTQYEMREIIERCFKECKEVGFIASFNTANAGEVDTIVNLGGICDHISKTLIGELQEFEILRKLGPMFRQFRSIENDMTTLDNVAARNSGFQELRISQK